MAKRRSEGELGVALRDVPDLATYVYRPPDPKGPEGVSNWKPCDFMLWVKRGSIEPWSAWFEAKDVDAVKVFAFSELRPSQVQGIHDAGRMGIPYWLCVYWRRDRHWTISDAVRVLTWRDENPVYEPIQVGDELVADQDRIREIVGGQRSEFSSPPTSIPRTLLATRFGIDSTPAQLASTLKAVLLGEV